MSDFKSKLPDLKELGSITGKLFKDLKSSVNEIIKDYKKKRDVTEAPPAAKAAPVKKAAPEPTETTVTKPAKAKTSKAKPEETK